MSKCPNKIFGKSKFYCDESIVLSGLCCIAYGSYLGIIFYRIKVGRVWKGMMTTKWTHSLLRILITILPLPLAGLIFLNFANLPVVVQAFFQGFIPLTIVGFLVFTFPLWLSVKLSWVNIYNKPRNYLYDEKYNTDSTI